MHEAQCRFTINDTYEAQCRTALHDFSPTNNKPHILQTTKGSNISIFFNYVGNTANLSKHAKGHLPGVPEDI
jgi:hypothetical protein